MAMTGNGPAILRRPASRKDVSHVSQTALLPGRARAGRPDGTYAPVRRPALRAQAAQGLQAAPALRLSAATFKAEVEQAAGQIAAILAANNRSAPSKPVAAALERARREQEEKT